MEGSEGRKEERDERAKEEMEARENSNSKYLRKQGNM